MSTHLCLQFVCKSALFHFYCIPRLIISRNSKLLTAFEAAPHVEREGKIFDMRNDLRCDKATEIGVTRLATVRCPTGLAFDIERQTCDWKTNVKNCDQLESKRTPRLFPLVRLTQAPFVFMSRLRQVYKVRPEANHVSQRTGL